MSETPPPADSELTEAAQRINEAYRGVGTIHSIGVGAKTVIVYSGMAVPRPTKERIRHLGHPTSVIFKVVGKIVARGAKQGE